MPPILSAQTVAVSFGVSVFGQGAALRSVGVTTGREFHLSSRTIHLHVSISLRSSSFPISFSRLLVPQALDAQQTKQAADLGHAQTTVLWVMRRHKRIKSWASFTVKSFNGYEVSLWGDEKVRKLENAAGWYLVSPNCTCWWLSGNIYVICILP